MFDTTSLAMSEIPVRFVLFISGILSNSEGISCDAALLGANVYVGSHFDNCNSFRSLSALDPHRLLQRVQNSLARIFANITK